MSIDEGGAGELPGRCVNDLGAAVHAANVVIRHRLGLYRALAAGPSTPAELAGRAGVRERHVAEWLAGQAAVERAVRAVGFSGFLVAEPTPFNLVFAARH